MMVLEAEHVLRIDVGFKLNFVWFICFGDGPDVFSLYGCARGLVGLVTLMVRKPSVCLRLRLCSQLKCDVSAKRKAAQDLAAKNLHYVIDRDKERVEGARLAMRNTTAAAAAQVPQTIVTVQPAAFQDQTKRKTGLAALFGNRRTVARPVINEITTSPTTNSVPPPLAIPQHEDREDAAIFDVPGSLASPPRATNNGIMVLAKSPDKTNRSNEMAPRPVKTGLFGMGFWAPPVVDKVMLDPISGDDHPEMYLAESNQ